MAEEEVPPDIRKVADPFVTEEGSSAYGKLERWIFDNAAPQEERARRIAIARKILVSGDYVSVRHQDYQRWVDPLLARINAAEAENWRALKEAGLILDDGYLEHEGVLVEGEFRRDEEMGGPKRYSDDRDRFRAIGFFLRASAVCKDAIKAGAAENDDLAGIYLALADCLSDRDEPAPGYLTDLREEPELSTRERNQWSRPPEESLIDGRSPALGANGEIHLPTAPTGFDEATSDLARQRWLIEEAARISPENAAKAKLQLSGLWNDWLGVGQLVDADYIYIEGDESELDPNAPGEFELHTLKSDQTILITATGLKRVSIPLGFRFIEILEKLIADPNTPDDELANAYWDLIDILSNRRQFKRCEQLARELTARLPEYESARWVADDFLESIKPEGNFLGTEPFLAGNKIEVAYISRNIENLILELWQLDVEKVLASPGERYEILRYCFENRGEIGFYGDDYTRFLPYFTQVKRWNAPIKKLPNHLQSQSLISIPVAEAGHYILVTRDHGKTSGVPINVEETMLVGTPIETDEANYLLLDSTTGQPVNNAEIIPLDYDYESSISPDHLGAFAIDGDARAIAIRRPGRPTEIKASVEATQYAGDPTPNREVKSLFVTNQPLYRPGQSVEFSCWVRQPGNRWLGTSEAYGDTKIRMEAEDPTGRIISTKTYALDDFGAFSGSFSLDPDIALGDCKVRLQSMGALSNPEPDHSDPFATATWTNFGDWRVEVGEFRKPDFRVEIIADEKRTDGVIGATVRATYNSGEPMIAAEVTAEFEAYPTNQILFPKSEFEWIYDTGYDWPLPESRWMPDWEIWGIHHSLLGETEDDISSYNTEATSLTTTGTTDGNGELKLVFPVSIPHLGRLSYECKIRAMVREFSGRGVVGSIDFTESGLSKSLFLSPNKGFYKTGEKVTLTLDAMGSERDPVPAEGSLRVHRLSYEDEERTPVYGEILEYPVSIAAEGSTSASFTPPTPGQYLCMFTCGDTRRGIVINVLDDGFDARDLRFNPIQLTPARSVCAPGDSIEVAIHCDKPDALVWLFQIMPDGRRQTPRMIRLSGKVAVVNIVAPLNGMPNFQLLAMTAANGSLHQARCQISLPPREQILAVELSSSPDKPAPGDELTLDLRVRDHLGAPTAASFAITAFDRPLEDLAQPLRKTRELLPESFDPFEEAFPLKVANRSDDREDEAFQQLWEPGCFSDRGGLVGRIVRRKESRFSKVGDELLVRYEPPELPNSVGGSGGAAIFPVTPATPTTYSYSRASASRIELTETEANALENTTARSNFADRAYWGAAMTTDAEGRARLSFPLPDNLTAWKAQAWAFGIGNRFGDAELEIPVSKPLQIRPVLPRSAVHGDKLKIAATVQNLSDHAAEFHLLLEVRDVETNLKGGKGEAKTVTVPAGGEGLVSWPVQLRSAGTAVFRFAARSTDGSLSDGTEQPLIVAPRTTPVISATSGVIARKAALKEFELDLSGMPYNSMLRVRLSARPALDAFAAIPQLVSYPFGCTEQTINRFLPLLVASKTVGRLGGDWEKMMKHVSAPDDSLGWIRGRPLLHAAPAKKILTAEKTDIIIRAGMKRLDEMANEQSNDAWSWFKGGEPSPYLTALALRASAVATKHGYDFREGGKPAKRISTWWLESHVQGRSKALAIKDSKLNPEDPFIVHVLSLTEGKDHLPLQKILLERRAELPVSGRIFLALSLDPEADADTLSKLLPTIHREMDPQDDKSTFYTQWWQDAVETRAWYLMLLTHLDPNDSRIPNQVERLLAMRTNGIVWKSTRDTALCVEAIAGTLSIFDLEPGSALEIPMEISAAGISEPVALNQGNLWTREVQIPVSKKDLVDGHLRFTINRKSASGVTIHASATVRYDADAMEHPTQKPNGLIVHRNYYLIRRDADPIPLTKKSELTAGDVVEVELRVQAPHPRKYVHLSDPIPAGLEPLHQLSGQEHGAYRETRLGETHIFIERLNGWNDTFRYRFHAVTPGTAFALPARAECMYAPSIFGSSPPATLTIKPRPGR